MILGYVLIYSDIKYNMFKNIKLDECAKYSNIYETNRIDPAMRIKTKRNISSTYDNFCIVSENFKNFCENEKYTGLEFVVLPNSPGLYWFKIHNIIEFDPEARNTRFINYNETCKGYEEIIGATSACLKSNIAIADGFFRTDIFFGSFANKSPLEIVGAITKQKLQKAGFKEIYFDKILDRYDWQK